MTTTAVHSLPEVTPAPSARVGEGETPLDRLLWQMRAWGAPASETERSSGPSYGRQMPRTVARPTTSMPSLRKKRASAATSYKTDDSGIGQSPVFRSVRKDTISFATSRRSSGASSSAYSYSTGDKRRSDDFTPATSIAGHSSLASPKSTSRARFGSTRPALIVDAKQPAIFDLYRAGQTTQSEVDRALLSRTGGSFVATLGLQTIPLPQSARQVDENSAAWSLPLPGEEGHQKTVSPTIASPSSQRVSLLRDAARDDLALTKPPISRSAHQRTRSRSMSDLRISLSPAAEATMPPRPTPLRSALRSPSPLPNSKSTFGKGPVVFEPADVTCTTWLSPRPRLAGHYKSDVDTSQGNPRRNRSQLSSVQRREAARRAHAKAARAARHRVSAKPPASSDPRRRSKPVGARWNRQTGFAESDSKIGSNPVWSKRGWRTPRRPAMRSMATQTPDGDFIMTRSRSNSESSMTRAMDADFVPRPRKRASSMVHYHASVNKDLPRRPRSSLAVLADPLRASQSGYPLESPGSMRDVTGPTVARDKGKGRAIDYVPLATLSPNRETDQPIKGYRSQSPSSTMISRSIGEEVQPQKLHSRRVSEHSEDESAEMRFIGRASSMSTSRLSESTMRPSMSTHHSHSSGVVVFQGESSDSSGAVTSHAPRVATQDVTSEDMRLSFRPGSLGISFSDNEYIDSTGEASPRLRNVRELPIEFSEQDMLRQSSRADSEMVTAPSTPAALPDRPSSGISASSWLDFNVSPVLPSLEQRQQIFSATIAQRASFLDMDTNESPSRMQEIERPAVELESSQHTGLDIRVSPPGPPVTPATTWTGSNRSHSEHLTDPQSSELGSTSQLSSPVFQRLSGTSLLPGSPGARDSGSFRSHLSLEAFPSPPPLSQGQPPIDASLAGGARRMSRSLDATISSPWTADFIEMESPERSLTRSSDDGRMAISPPSLASEDDRRSRSRSEAS